MDVVQVIGPTIVALISTTLAGRVAAQLRFDIGDALRAACTSELASAQCAVQLTASQERDFRLALDAVASSAA